MPMHCPRTSLSWTQIFTQTAKGLDLSRFDTASLMALTATKEMDYGTETNRRI